MSPDHALSGLMGGPNKVRAIIRRLRKSSLSVTCQGGLSLPLETFLLGSGGASKCACGHTFESCGWPMQGLATPGQHVRRARTL